MKCLFKNKAIGGMLLVLPANEKTFLEEMEQYDFPKARSIALKNVMGYDRHRLATDGVCVSDLAVKGLEHLFAKGLLKAEEIDALIVVTQTPDHLIPPTSCIIHGALGLNPDVYCMDINQGCSGFLVGLIEGFSLLEQPEVQKVVLINADILSRKISSKDRNSYPLVGDAAAITILENSETPNVVHGLMKTDGSRHAALIVPAGGLRMPSTASTAMLRDAGDGNWRALDHLRMEGSEVFNFVMADVPPLIDELLDWAGETADGIDYFLCHQPNRFMLQKLADRLNVPYEKMPSNVVEHYGNSSGATIPACTVLNLADTITSQSYHVCFAGFGVGLTWGAITIQLPPLRFCEKIDI